MRGRTHACLSFYCRFRGPKKAVGGTSIPPACAACMRRPLQELQELGAGARGHRNEKIKGEGGKVIKIAVVVERRHVPPQHFLVHGVIRRSFCEEVVRGAQRAIEEAATEGPQIPSCSCRSSKVRRGSNIASYQEPESTTAPRTERSWSNIDYERSHANRDGAYRKRHWRTA